MRLLVLSILLSFQSFGIETIKLAATEWCPYSCSTQEGGGIVAKYFREILKENNYKLEIVFLPWSRAIDHANKSIVDGLLTAVHSEAPKLKFTTTPTMNYRSCLFGLEASKPIKSLEDLSKYKVGAIENYAYGNEIDQYISKNKKDKRKILLLNGDNPLNRLFSMLDKDRIDYFVEDSLVSHFHFGAKAKEIFCFKEKQFFMALSPKFLQQKKVLSILNKGLKDKSKLDKIIEDFKKSKLH
jgi:polar amino acid transport system substrate-binding protein